MHGHGDQSNIAQKLPDVNKKTAMTLAEVLITLLIIGIICILTVPTLIAKKAKSETIAQLQKNYSMLSQVVKLSEIENGSNEYWDWGTTGNVNAHFNKYWAPYLRISKICSTYSNCGYNDIRPWLMPNGTSVYDLYCVHPATRTALILQDGTFLVIKNFESSGTLTKTIFIDLNGAKLPNQFGKDVFMFVLDPNMGFVPYGYQTNNDPNNNCKKTANGSTCAAKIMKDSWRIKDDYPW